MTLSSLLFAPAWAQGPVYFVDAALKAAVEAELWVWDPTAADMLGLIYLSAGVSGIEDITGLEYAKNLQHLDLHINQISDISALAGLTNLTTLVLNNNRLSDISALSDLVSLEHLDIHRNIGLDDLWALSGLTNLQTLDVRESGITDISPLSYLAKLQELDLRYDRVVDISALSGLNELRYLCLQFNRISDVSALSELTCLEYLDLRGNPLDTEACDVHLPAILANNSSLELLHDPCIRYHRVRVSSTAGGSVVMPGEGEFTYENGELALFIAQANPGFAFTGWSGTHSDSQNPTTIIMGSDGFIQANFQSLLDTLHVDGKGRDNPGWEYPSVADGSEERPFDSIQEAIEVAANGTTVIVRPGTYHENIDLLGKSIHLTGSDPNAGPLPIIDGNGAGPVVSFTSGEDPNCMLTGFVVAAGRDYETSGIVCLRSSPSIANCLIVGNRATGVAGAAVRCTDSYATLTHCTIADNIAGEQGGAMLLIDSHVMVTNSILWANVPNEIALGGNSVATITYTDVAGGWPDVGNIDADPLFVRPGHWLEGADPKAPVWIMGDYHLKSRAGRWDPNDRAWVPDDVTSPCIDAGDPAAPVGLEPHPNGGIVNMGTYGGTVQAGKSCK
jgi:hypothetical protein